MSLIAGCSSLHMPQGLDSNIKSQILTQESRSDTPSVELLYLFSIPKPESENNKTAKYALQNLRSAASVLYVRPIKINSSGHSFGSGENYKIAVSPIDIPNTLEFDIQFSKPYFSKSQRSGYPQFFSQDNRRVLIQVVPNRGWQMYDQLFDPEDSSRYTPFMVRYRK